MLVGYKGHSNILFILFPRLIFGWFHKKMGAAYQNQFTLSAVPALHWRKWRRRFSNKHSNFPFLLNFGKPFYCKKKLKILDQIYIKVREGSSHNIMHKNIGVWGKVLQVTLNLMTMVLHTNNWQPCQAETLSLTFI